MMVVMVVMLVTVGGEGAPHDELHVPVPGLALVPAGGGHLVLTEVQGLHRLRPRLPRLHLHLPGVRDHGEDGLGLGQSEVQGVHRLIEELVHDGPLYLEVAAVSKLAGVLHAGCPLAATSTPALTPCLTALLTLTVATDIWIIHCHL